MEKSFAVMGAVFAFLSVAMGAFAAHILRGNLPPELFHAFEVGARYQMYHALGLLAVSLFMSRHAQSSLAAAGWLFAAGCVLFSGSLYALALTRMRWIGIITPIGGTCFLLGWLLFAWSLLRPKRPGF